MKNNWICIKDFPEDIFLIKEDVYKVGKIFEKWTCKIHLLSHLEGYNINDYIIPLSELRQKQIDSIFNE